MRTVRKCTIRIFFKDQLFCLRISLFYSFFLSHFLLFHFYKKFLVFTECTLCIVFNFVQTEIQTLLKNALRRQKSRAHIAK